MLDDIGSQIDKISTHTFLAEGDTHAREICDQNTGFQPTPSSRKVTAQLGLDNSNYSISTHTFLAEGDFRHPVTLTERRISTHTFLAEGDSFSGRFEYIQFISTHTFLAEGDSLAIP